MAETPPVGLTPPRTQPPLRRRTCTTCVRLRQRLRQISSWATDEQLDAFQAHLDAHRAQDHDD